MSEQDFRPGLRFAITWLHSRANEMNDAKAKQILDSAAFALGVAKAKGGFVLNDDYEALRERLAEVERERDEYFLQWQNLRLRSDGRLLDAAEEANKRLRAETIEECAKVADKFKDASSFQQRFASGIIAHSIRSLASETAGGGE